MSQHETPNWVIWNDDIIIEKIIKRMFKDYCNDTNIQYHYYNNLQDFFQSVADEHYVENMGYEKIRYAISFIENYEYDHEFYDKHKCAKYIDQKRAAVSNFNKWFNDHLPNGLLELYNFFDETNNEEKFNGDRRYALLDKTSRKPYTEMACLKAAVRFQYFIDNNKTLESNIQNALLLSKYLKIPYWEFGYACDKLKYDAYKSKEDFDALNRMQIRELKAQDAFVDAVMHEHNIFNAYYILSDNDIIRS